jgi:hypothetical protein
MINLNVGGVRKFCRNRFASHCDFRLAPAGVAIWLLDSILCLPPEVQNVQQPIHFLRTLW